MRTSTTPRIARPKKFWESARICVSMEGSVAFRREALKPAEGAMWCLNRCALATFAERRPRC